MNAPRLLGAFLLLLMPVVAAAQVLDYREQTSRLVTAGIKRGTYTYPVRGGMAEIQSLTVELAHPRILATAVLPPEGPHVPALTEVLARSAGALSSVTLDQQPPPSEPAHLNGFRHVQGSVYSWPPEGVHLVLQHEGTAEFSDILPGTLTARFDDDTSLTLTSINGPITETGISVYTGLLAARDLPVAAWTADTLCIVLNPANANADPHDLFLPVEARERRFVPGEVLDRNSTSLKSNQAALVLRGPIDQILLEKVLRRTPLTITLEMDERYLLPKSVLPVGSWLMQRGVLLEGLAEEDAQNVIALSADGNRLMALSTSQLRGRGGASGKEVAAFLSDDGFTEAVRLHQGSPMVLPEVKRAGEYRKAALAPARLVLAFAEGAPSISLSGVEGDFVRLKGVIVDGTRSEFPANLPFKVRDERFTPMPGLDQFWATPFDRSVDLSFVRPGDNPFGLRLFLSQPMRIAAVELIHAEAVGFSPEFNLKKYRIVGRPDSRALWRELAFYDHEEPVRRVRISLEGAPRLQEIRLEVLEPSFISEGSVARLAEVFLWGPAQ